MKILPLYLDFQWITLILISIRLINSSFSILVWKWNIRRFYLEWWPQEIWINVCRNKSGTCHGTWHNLLLSSKKWRVPHVIEWFTNLHHYLWLRWERFNRNCLPWLGKPIVEKLGDYYILFFLNQWIIL